MTLFEGITARRVETPRLTAGVLERDGDDAGAVADRTIVFIHGNVSSADFWQKTMLALPRDLRLLAIDLRGFGRSDTLPVDATRGVRDFADDLHAVLEALGLGAVHLVGWSLGAGVVMQYAIDHPALSVTLESPLSPFGLGGTHRDGTLIFPDAAGTGAGLTHPDFVARIAAEDETADASTSPRSVFRNSYIDPAYVSRNEDVWVDSMLTTATGDDNYPGTSVASDNWPGFAPGDRGVQNALSPKYYDLTAFAHLTQKPGVLWVHGDRDIIVGDASICDAGALGARGKLADWPGADVVPAQPMLAQIRDLLDAYAAGGGHVVELALPGVGHTPHLEEPEDFRAALLRRIDYVPPMGPPTEVIILRSAD